MGFLGNQAPYTADLNLVAQLVVLIVLLAGVYFVRSSKLKAHGRLMKSAVVVQLGALAFWMGPSLVFNIEAFRSFTSGPIITVLHALGGLLALVLAIIASYHTTIGSLQLKWTMRSAFTVWTLTLVLGMGFYAYYYLH